VIDESDLQDEKHFDPTISTFFGIKIDWSDENEDENAFDSIRVNREFDSKQIHCNFVVSFKGPRPNRRIDSGIQTRTIWIKSDLNCVKVSTKPLPTTIRRT
jgi:hypothetical protein